jgi:hypothetical protein
MSTPQTSSPLWRKILGAVLGLCAAVTVILIVQSLGEKIWPIPPGVNFRDPVQAAAFVRGLPAGALLWVALSYFAGTLAGGYMALKVARDVWTTWPAVAVEGVLLAFGVVNLMGLPHPGWFWVVALGSFPLGAFTAIWLARKTAGRAFSASYGPG